MIGLRFVQGMCGAMVNANGIAIVVAAFPPAERGKALGITAAIFHFLPKVSGNLTKTPKYFTPFVVLTTTSRPVVLCLL